MTFPRKPIPVALIVAQLAAERAAAAVAPKS